MQIDRKTIESNLPTKGFVREDSKHRYFYHEYQGKRTGAYTYTSHGSGYKTYGINLIKMMKTQLRLNNNKEVFNLCECPIDGDDYNQILIDKGLFTP
jgi:hypothetical protein